MNAGKTKATVTWQKMTHGSHVFEPGNAVNFQTGDWRSDKPRLIKEKCKQCLLCFPVCPDSALPLNAKGEIDRIDFDFCKGCMACKEVCPFGAIEKEGA